MTRKPARYLLGGTLLAVLLGLPASASIDDLSLTDTDLTDTDLTDTDLIDGGELLPSPLPSVTLPPVEGLLEPEAEPTNSLPGDDGAEKTEPPDKQPATTTSDSSGGSAGDGSTGSGSGSTFDEGSAGSAALVTAPNPTLSSSMGTLASNMATLAGPLSVPIALAAVVAFALLVATRRPGRLGKVEEERTWGEGRTYRL